MGAGTLGGVTSVLGLISGVTVDDAAATTTGLVIAPHGSAKNVSLTLASAEIFSGGTATSLTALSATIRVAAGAAHDRHAAWARRDAGAGRWQRDQRRDLQRLARWPDAVRPRHRLGRRGAYLTGAQAQISAVSIIARPAREAP